LTLVEGGCTKISRELTLGFLARVVATGRMPDRGESIAISVVHLKGCCGSSGVGWQA
jgi:hypothetical protein